MNYELPEWKRKLWEIWDRRNTNAGVWEIEDLIESLITAHDRELIERIESAKLPETIDNFNYGLDKAIQLIREGDK